MKTAQTSLLDELIVDNFAGGGGEILTHLSLFSGIGGLDLAAEWAGFQTVGQCEFADYPTRVLEKHWPNVPRRRDIRTLTGGDFFARTGLRTVDVISGGFPCQPLSVAGKRGGKEDDRYLWPEMLRVIEELRPTWVVGENVAGLVNMALDTVLSDLEGKGYTTRTFVIPACGVDAPHQRYRCAIVARNHDRVTYSPVAGISEGQSAKPCGTGTAAHPDSDVGRSWRAEPEGQWREAGTPNGGRDVANAKSTGLSNGDGVGKQRQPGFEHSGENVDDSNGGGRTGHNWREPPKFADGCRWAAEPNVGRVAYGIPKRVDRLRCLGNAVVPQQFYPVFRAIMSIEEERHG